jgi:TetR/AcrR family transcriptional regulator, transcriptional repressor for nem operon
MSATGLEKGGIYNHFASKQDLMLDAFEYAVQLLETQYRAGLSPKSGAFERLNGILATFEGMIVNPVVRGGCPMLNAAIESDDALPELRDRVRRAMNGWITTVKGIVERGKLEGQIRLEVDAEEVSSVLFATLEGAVMLSNLYRDPAHIRRAVSFLRTHLETLKTSETDRQV